MIKSALGVIGLLALAYLYFFIPLGDMTLHQHVMRIAATEEAQELSREANEAAERLREQVEGLRGDAGADAAQDAAPNPE